MDRRTFLKSATSALAVLAIPLRKIKPRSEWVQYGLSWSKASCKAEVYFDRVNDYHNIYTTSLSDAFDDFDGTVTVGASIRKVDDWPTVTPKGYRQAVVNVCGDDLLLYRPMG